MKDNYFIIHGSFSSPFSNWIPYLRNEVEKAFADTIATKQNIIPNGGHLNTESGYQEFQELLTEI